MSESTKFTFIVEKTRNGFSAYEEHLPIFTIGNTMAEVKNNAQEAINLYFDNDLDQIDQELIELTLV